MKPRSATDTIAGYFYQFDYSIWTVLSLLNDTDEVSIECIEDIDIHSELETTAIQCKYYAGSEYNHSLIKSAVMLMLTHFKNVKERKLPTVKYKIWGHYKSGQHKLPLPFDINFLKDHFLTFKEDNIEHFHHLDLGLSDDALEEFRDILEININAKNLNEQLSTLITLLQTRFECSQFAAEYFFYNSALRIIRDLSILPEESQRRISKKDFLSRVDTSSILFNEWFVFRKGKKSHFAALRSNYFSSLNVSPFERFFLIDVDPLNYNLIELKELAFIISKKYSKLTKIEPTPFCPYIYLHGIPQSIAIELKGILIAENLKIIDGHDFQGASFNANSILVNATYGNGIKLKFINTLSDLSAAITTSKATRCIYQFHHGNVFFDLAEQNVKHIKIQIEKLSDIKEII